VRSGSLRPTAPVSERGALSAYSRFPKNPALQQLQKCSKSASTTPQRPIWNCFVTVGVRDFLENGCMKACQSPRASFCQAATSRRMVTEARVCATAVVVPAGTGRPNADRNSG